MRQRVEQYWVKLPLSRYPFHLSQKSSLVPITGGNLVVPLIFPFMLGKIRNNNRSRCHILMFRGRHSHPVPSDTGFTGQERKGTIKWYSRIIG